LSAAGVSERDLRDEAAGLLRDLLRIDTSNPPGRETAAATLLKEYLEASGVACELVARDPERANLIARIPGTGDGPSLALVGHTDVVPAEPRDWTHPPFSGHLDNEGYLWGRGAADMKNETATRAVAMAALARSGFRPGGDIVFIAEADEEDGTERVGMVWLVHERPDIRTDFALNEGAAERLELADGRTVVTISVGEKSALAARVTALGEATATTMPGVANGSVPRLATLISRIAAHRPARRLLPETAQMLEALLGTTEGDLDASVARLESLHPAFADLLTPLFAPTIAPTRLRGSSALNVMPARASTDCDCRLLPGDTEADLLRELAEALGDDVPHEVEIVDGLIGGSISTTDSPLFGFCRDFVAANDPGTVLVPTILNGYTDSHPLRAAFGTVAYGIWPVRRTPYDVVAAGVHGADERIHVDDLGYATRFHIEACRAIGAVR
jgi:acetylornithine deacetylase/succinyl-diaminopimelate desuccinylase-like protein